MYFSQALITALSLSAATQAMPLKHVARDSSHDLTNFNKLAIRGAPAEILRANMLLGRAPTPELIAAADEIQVLAARQSTGSSNSITGVLQVLSCLLDILLGRDNDACTAVMGNSTSNSTNATAASRQQLAGMLTDLSGMINSTTKDVQASKKSAKSNKKATRSLLVRDDASINDVLTMLNQLGQLVQKLMTDLTALGLRQQQDGEDDSDADSTTDFPSVPTETGSTDEQPTDTASSSDDQPTDTSSSDEPTETATTTDDDSADTAAPTSSATSAAAAEKTSGTKAGCPDPYPNDGMYRPGCPGYGRKRRSLKARDASQEQLKQVLPALATIIEAMPGLLSSAGANATSTNTTSAASSTLGDGKGANATSAASNLTAIADSSSYKKVVKDLNKAINALNGNATDSAANATSTASASATSSAASAHNSAAAAAVAQSHKSETNDRQAVAAAQIAHGSRDLSALLNADGFQYVRRSNGDSDASQANQNGINVSALNNLLNGLLSASDGTKRANGNSTASQANQGGINIDALNNLLNGLLSGRDGLSRRSNGDSDASQANQGGINIDLLNNLLNGLLSGRDVAAKRSNGNSDASQANQGGINIDLLNNLLNGVLSGRDVEERGTSKADLAAINKLFSQVLSGHAK